MNRKQQYSNLHRFHPNCRGDNHGLNSASLFTLLCAKVFVVLDSALTQIQKVLKIHMAGSSTSVLHAFSTHPYGRMVMKKKLLNVAYATLFPSSLKSSTFPC